MFHHWGLDACVLGEVTVGPEVELWWKGERLCQIDPKLLTENAPIYDRAYTSWEPKHKVHHLSKSPSLSLEKSLSSIQGTSRSWIYRQYDQRVGGATVRDCEESVAVVRLPESGRALGLVLGCRPHIMRLDARLGGYDAAFYPALELAAKGFQPLAITDCLNFGNPEKPEVMSEFVAAVEALADASKVMDAPVISGNVSFYNETLNQNITSTPATGSVGLRDHVKSIPRSHFVQEGDSILLWRFPGVHLLSDLTLEQTKAESSEPPSFSGELDPEPITRWLQEVTELGCGGRVQASRVVGKFGLQYALYRMCTDQLGANVKRGDWAGRGSPADWKDERLYEILLVGNEALIRDAEDRARRTGTHVWKLGTVEAGALTLDNERKGLSGLHEAYHNGWRKHFPELA
ncbi:MAG: AIR synthase related protein [Bdellovibrionales bacterium]